MIKLRDFQKAGVRHIYDHSGRALLADEQGLGKTIQALYWILKTPKHRPALIICPASMKWTWQSEAREFGLHAEVLEGKRPSKLDATNGNIFIINFDILKAWMPVLRRLRPKVVVVDEIHYIKNKDAQRTKCCFKLCRQAKSVVGLSGTPIPNHLIELWAPIHCINPHIFPSYHDYAMRYCKPKFTIYGWTYKGARHKKELHRILKDEVMIRRLKKDVAKELPPKVRKVISFKLKDYSEYREADRDLIGWLQKKSLARAMRARKSKHLVKLGYLLRLVADLKMKFTIEWLEEWAEANPGKKMVGLSMHRKVLDKLHKRFPNSVKIDGEVTGRMRAESVSKFQNNRKVRWFWGHWKAAGVGLTLHAAHNFVALDFPWDPGTLVQGEDRTHRIGQKFPVTVYYLAVLHTVEEKLMKLLSEKAKILDAVMDGRRKAIALDIYNELLTYMKHEELKLAA